VTRNTSGLKRGGPSRKKGVPNKATADAKTFAEGLVDDPVYRAKLRVPREAPPRLPRPEGGAADRTNVVALREGEAERCDRAGRASQSPRSHISDEDLIRRTEELLAKAKQYQAARTTKPTS